MVHFLKAKAYILFPALFIISTLPFFIRIFSTAESHRTTSEMYNSNLLRLNSISKIIDFADSTYLAQNGALSDTQAYVSNLSTIMRNRFYHGPLNYSLSDNWIAYLGGKILWSHLSSIVIPEHILNNDHGLCSQQTIVFMEALRQKKISVRSVGLGYKEGPGHFLCEVKYKGSWHLHDVSIEPAWKNIKNHHNSLEYYLDKKDSLYKAYESKLDRSTFEKIMERNEYGEADEMPAKQMKIFHRITLSITYILPLLFFCLSFYFIRKKNNSVHKPQVKAQNVQAFKGKSDVKTEPVSIIE